MAPFLGKFNIYVVDSACLTVITRREKKNTIKLTSLHPFMSDRKLL